MTKFRAVRSFVFAGRDVAVGEVLLLDDDQARELVELGGTIEPVEPRDKGRVVTRPRLEWGPSPLPEDVVRDRKRIGYF